jgi:hypothetical protein
LQEFSYFETLDCLYKTHKYRADQKKDELTKKVAFSRELEKTRVRS